MNYLFLYFLKRSAFYLCLFEEYFNNFTPRSVLYSFESVRI